MNGNEMSKDRIIAEKLKEIKEKGVRGKKVSRKQAIAIALETARRKS